MDAQREAAVIAARHGVMCVHEMAMPDKRGRRDGEILLRHAADLPIDVLVYIADLDIDYVVGLGLPRIGGDLFLDGSIGARTAAVHERYADGDGDGILTYEDDTLGAFLEEAHHRGLQVALHVIGERAIEQP